MRHLQTAHNISETMAKEYRWRRPTKVNKKKCIICGVRRVRLDRHLKVVHTVSIKDNRLQYLEAMERSCLRLKADNYKPLAAESDNGKIPKVYTPPLFTKRYDFIWNAYADHIRRRIFTQVRSVEESVTRTILEAIHVIELVDRRGNLQNIFDVNHQDGTPGDRFERFAFAIITNELRIKTTTASSWTNRLRSLMKFLNFLFILIA